MPTVYIDGELPPPEENHSANFVSLNKDHRQIDLIWSPMTLPFQEDLNRDLQQKFSQLTSGGLLYLSTPITHYFRNPPPMPGQINFFRSKNIMFLLEQHGFKMTWRQNRFSSILRIVARKG
ncbi:MAG: hypothetical protein JKY45_09060 [Emcibacter sp.]|nr:hypothetical protein [Emcibacter sp.]